jgi:hypothetical protein
MICESPVEDNVVQEDDRLIIDCVDDVGFSWDEVVSGNMASSSALRNDASKGRTEMCPWRVKGCVLWDIWKP